MDWLNEFRFLDTARGCDIINTDVLHYISCNVEPSKVAEFIPCWKFVKSFLQSSAPEMPDVPTEVVAKLMSFISDFESSSFSVFLADEERDSKDLQRRKPQKFTSRLSIKVWLNSKCSLLGFNLNPHEKVINSFYSPSSLQTVDQAQNPHEIQIC